MATVENQKIEFKENWRDDALKTVCAFANTNGGVIYIGLDDGGESVNLKDEKRALTDIPNKIKDFLGIVADVKAVKKGGRDIIKITVGKYNAPISYKGSFYVRSGSTTSELKGVELARFLFARTGISWDRTVERNASIEDINVDSVRRFQRIAEPRFPFINKEKSIKLVLEKLNLIEDGGLRRAAILLFGKKPKKYFTTAFVQIGRFASESEVISTDVVEGNLVEQLEKTIELLRLKYLENRFYFEGIYRKEDLIYPEDALREAVINALIHRDYLGPHTQLRVYDDKLWLWNAGRLSREMTFAGLKKPHSSYPRNELLADIFFKAGFIEAWGSGTLKIVNKCRQASLPEPEFSEMTGGFLTSFFKHRVTEKVTERVTERVTEKQEIILDEIRRNPYITVKVLSETAGISERKIKENIKKLKQKKLIERVGPARGGRWEAGG